MPIYPLITPESTPSFSELFPTPEFDLLDLDLDAILPKKGPTQGLVYQYKITLMGINPPIWRRIQVPAKYSFWDLHVAIADTMGWLDYHLHLFSVRNHDSGELDPIGIYDADDLDGPHCLPDYLVPIAGYFRFPGDRSWYTYDYGDEWVHDVVLEGILLREKGKRYPVCLDGRRACPPEDAGGPPGYLEMLRAQDDPSHPAHEVYREWLGGRFDPDYFDPRKVRFDSPRKRWENAFRGDRM